MAAKSQKAVNSIAPAHYVPDFSQSENALVRNLWPQNLTKIKSEEPFLLNEKEYKFFSEEIGNINLSELKSGLEEIVTLTDCYGSRLFVKELGHKRNYSTRALLYTKYKNPEHYNEILTLLKLNQDRKIKYIPRFIMPEGKLNPLVKQDMDCILNGKNYFPQFDKTTSKFEIFTKTQTGEAFSIGEKMYVRTENGYEALKMDKRTYEILFPPVDRYAIAQGYSQNCGPLAIINNMIQIPKNRIKMYKLFEQKNDKVAVHTLGNIFKRTTFKLNELDNLDDGILADTCYGVKMLEKHANKDFDIAKYGLYKPQEKDKYFCKSLISKKGTPFMSESNIKLALQNRWQEDIDSLKNELSTLGKTTTLVSGGAGSYNLGTGYKHYISVFDCTNGMIKYSNPHGTAEYRIMPMDDFIKKVYGSAFFHKI